MLFPPLNSKEIRLMFGAAILANVLFFGLAGCLYFGKPYALQKSEHLAQRIQTDGGATNVLRAWFTEIQLRPDSTGKEPGYLVPSRKRVFWETAWGGEG